MSPGANVYKQALASLKLSALDYGAQGTFKLDDPSFGVHEIRAIFYVCQVAVAAHERCCTRSNAERKWKMTV